MDWEDEAEELSASLESALQEAERAYAHRGANITLQTVATAPTEPATAAAAPPLLAGGEPPGGTATTLQQPAVPRRRLPSILGGVKDSMAAVASTPAAAAAAGAAPAADENLPAACFTGALRYAFTAYEVDLLCQSALASGVTFGFDIEWRVTYRAGQPPRPVALVQLCYQHSPTGAGRAAVAGTACSDQYCCLLLHIHHSGLTPHLRQLLCSKDVLKVGVGAHGDALKLWRDFHVEMQGVVCLSEYANARMVNGSSSNSSSDGSLTCQPPASSASADTAVGSKGPEPAAPAALGCAPQKWSLARLAGALLRQRLDKSPSVRCSDWEQRHLSQEQQQYAATDAWVSLRIYEILSKMPVAAPAPASLAVPLAPSDGAEAAAAPPPPFNATGGWAPACTVLRHLQPAKLAVYQALVLQGLSTQQVAAQRCIQEDSVQGYMAEAITAGYAYNWSSLGVPDNALQCVAEVCGSLLERPLQLQLASSGAAGCSPGSQPAAALQQDGLASCDQQQQQGQQQQGQQQQGQQQQGQRQEQQPGIGSAAHAVHQEQHAQGGRLQVGAKRPPPSSPGSLAASSCGGRDSSSARCLAGSREPQAGEALAAAACREEAEPVDVLQQLLAAGHKLRELKEQHFSTISYGQLRLALAHLGRCNPGPW